MKMFSSPQDLAAKKAMRAARSPSPQGRNARSPTAQASKIRESLGQDGLCICILGGTKFNSADNEELVKALARSFESSIGATKAFFVTGGMPGVQEVFAKSFGRGSRVFNLLPKGQSSGYGVGKDIHGGANLDERKEIFGEIGDVYITIEGGPGVAQEARAAYEREAVVIPLVRSGGASGGMFDFPQALTFQPGYATEAQWRLICSPAVAPDVSADAVVTIVQTLLKYHSLHGDELVMAKQQSIVGRQSTIWQGSIVLLAVLFAGFFLLYASDIHHFAVWSPFPQSPTAAPPHADGDLQLSGMVRAIPRLISVLAGACAFVAIVLRTTQRTAPARSLPDGDYSRLLDA